LGDVVIGEYIHYADYGKDLPGKFVPRYFPLAHPTPSLVRRHTDWLKLGGWAHDMLKPGSGTSPTIFHGEIVAVEAVAGNPGSMRQQGWIKHFDKALAVEMESGGVARAIHDTDSVHYNPRWFVIRGISDSVVGGAAAAKLLSRSNQEERNHWHEYAAQVAARVTRLLTQRLVKSPRLAHPEQPGSPAWSTGGGAP
jgi:nucleoside phosphorylase